MRRRDFAYNQWYRRGQRACIADFFLNTAVLRIAAWVWPQRAKKTLTTAERNAQRSALLLLCFQRRSFHMMVQKHVRPLLNRGSRMVRLNPIPGMDGCVRVLPVDLGPVSNSSAKMSNALVISYYR